jgi:Flp pilus assembly protein CpaB
LGFLSMRFVRAAVVVIAPLLLAGCFAASTPTAGTISSCAAGLDAVRCRDIAQTAMNAYEGPALSADKIEVAEWESCHLPAVEMRSTEAASDGVTCYGILAVANSGGRRVSEGVYDGGTMVTMDSVVWTDAAGALHAVTKATQ